MAYTGKVTSAESLGRILQQARLMSGLSQRELARRLGTTQKYVWELEAGKPSIVMDRLFAAMRETGMELTATDTPPDEHGLPGRRAVRDTGGGAQGDLANLRLPARSGRGRPVRPRQPHP